MCFKYIEKRCHYHSYPDLKEFKQVIIKQRKNTETGLTLDFESLTNVTNKKLQDPYSYK